MLLLVAHLDANRLLRSRSGHHFRQRLLRGDSIGGARRGGEAHHCGIRRHFVGLSAESLFRIIEESAKDMSCAGDARSSGHEEHLLELAVRYKREDCDCNNEQRGNQRGELYGDGLPTGEMEQRITGEGSFSSIKRVGR